MPTIRHAEPDDIGRLARTANRAFVDDPLMRWLFPDEHDYVHVNPQLVSYLCRRSHAMRSLWCTDDGVAMAAWIPPEPPEVELPDPAIEVSEERLAKLAALGETMAANMPPEPHWYLNVLATHPDWQRQGLGAALMSVVFAIADDAGIPCYLVTETVENVAYYRHHGFEVRTEWDLSTGFGPGPHLWGMVRLLA